MRNINGVNYLSVKEVAEKFGVHPKTIKRWISSPNKKPRIEYILCPFTDRLFFKEAEIDGLINKIYTKNKIERVL